MTRHTCRLCGAPLTEPFLDLGSSPLSNALVDAEHLARPDPVYPLRVYVCESCWLVQLPEVESPARIFGDYPYFSSYSSTWLDHVRGFAGAMRERFGLGPQSLVIEAASNDGHLLAQFQQAGIKVLGIEPARNVARAARARGVPTLSEFVGVESARRLVAQEYRADLLVANNVLAHVPDLHDFATGLATLLKPTGVLTLEFPHVLRLLERVEFDTIYHEHFSYFSLGTALRALERAGLQVFDVEELPTHGGSLRVYASHAGRARAANAIAELEETETRAGLRRRETYDDFARRVDRAKKKLIEFLRSAHDDGALVAGYGAPAKATTLLNTCGIGTDLLPFTVDRSPHKQGRYVPGVRTPIFPPEKIFEERPAYVLILPWNIAEEVREQMAGISEWGGRFVVPVPALEVVA
ncbi:MAG: class I SAM-dependent methyltransferase [Candidatus Eremiobacteraeota bacterium]|nr:class I SAM-dependent methyltransferase [Candidatus Eremiobacteraeota bacterium]